MSRLPHVYDAETTAAWVAWAAIEGLVRLADGREAKLIHFAPSGGRHKVRYYGRHERIAPEMLVEAVSDVARTG